MNYELPGVGSQVTSSAQKASTLSAGPYKAALIEINPRWGRPDVGLRPSTRSPILRTA